MAARLLFNQKVLTGVDMTNAIVSTSLDVSECVSCTTHIFWNGTPNGTIIIEASNDDINFSLLDSKPANKITGSFLVNYLYPAFRFIRITYSPAPNQTSTGTLNAFISGKSN